MKFFILIIFCAFSLTASAQFWKKFLKHKTYPRYAQLPPAAGTASLPFIKPVAMPLVYVINLRLSGYELELQEDCLLDAAKHNMHFGIFNVASYNFSDLAALYLKQNRFSEAKWYLLQSNGIARQENDCKHIIANLLALADLKIKIGENGLAKIDLAEAHNLAAAKNMIAAISEIEKRQYDLRLNKPLAVKPEFRYAEAVELANKMQ